MSTAEDTDRQSALTAFMDAVPDALIAVAPRGVVTAVNSAAVTLIGLDAGQLVGRPARALFGELPPESAEDHRRELDRPNRAPLAVSVRRRSVRGTEASLLRLRAADSLDRLDDEVRNRDAMLHSSCETARLGWFEIDLDARTARCSPEVLETLGIGDSTGEVSLTRVFELLHRDDVTATELALVEAGRSGELPALETRWRPPDGASATRILLARGRMAPGSGGVGRRLVGVVQDVTRRRETEAEVRVVRAVWDGLGSWASSEGTARRLLERLADATGCTAAALWATHGVEDVRCVDRWAASAHLSRAYLRETADTRHARREDLPGRALEAGAPIVVEDLVGTLGGGRTPAFRQAGLQSALAFPLVCSGAVVGVVELLAPGALRTAPSLARTLEFMGRHIGEFMVRRESDPVEAPITAREQEVLQLAARGLTGARIAAELVVSLSTVKTHFEKIYVKLGVSDRPAAVAEGFRRRLID